MARQRLPFLELPPEAQSVLIGLIKIWLRDTDTGKAVVAAADGDEVDAGVAVLELIEAGHAMAIFDRETPGGLDNFRIKMVVR